jgi:hypothetical protein
MPRKNVLHNVIKHALVKDFIYYFFLLFLLIKLFFLKEKFGYKDAFSAQNLILIF